MEKYYKISESELVELISKSIKIDVYGDVWPCSCVDLYSVKKKYFPNATGEEIINIGFEDCAKSILTKYEEVED